MNLFQAVIHEFSSLSLKLVELEALFLNDSFLLELIFRQVTLLPLAVQKWFELAKVFLLVRNHYFLQLLRHVSVRIMLHLLQQDQVQVGLWVLLPHSVVFDC